MNLGFRDHVKVSSPVQSQENEDSMWLHEAAKYSSHIRTLDDGRFSVSHLW